MKLATTTWLHMKLRTSSAIQSGWPSGSSANQDRFHRVAFLFRIEGVPERGRLRCELNASTVCRLAPENPCRDRTKSTDYAAKRKHCQHHVAAQLHDVYMHFYCSFMWRMLVLLHTWLAMDSLYNSVHHNEYISAFSLLSASLCFRAARRFCFDIDLWNHQKFYHHSKKTLGTE